MMRPTLHLMVGLPGSGKTTKAKQLERDEGAIRFSPDEWQLALFGNDMEDPLHDERHSKVEQIMWSLAEKLLARGVSVILDYGFWTIEERRSLYQEAVRLDVLFQVHFMDVDKDELLKRVAQRNVKDAGRTFPVLPEEMEKWYMHFQPVTPQEEASYRDRQPD